MVYHLRLGGDQGEGTHLFPSYTTKYRFTETRLLRTRAMMPEEDVSCGRPRPALMASIAAAMPALKYIFILEIILFIWSWAED